MSEHLAEQPTASDRVVTAIRRLRVPIVLFWMFLATATNVFVPGNQAEEPSLQSVNALHDIINKPPAPPGIHAYVAGSAAQITDQFEVGNASTVLVTELTVTVIAIMLLIVYRSPTTMLLAL